ncbi:hypothetical protein TNIN_136731 [Trichonephila inaurata madagascariensis]|uniref:Uncharacterized protein n=1 Tax=Trichonephila inaurata madagascariensis TaxID=2747483 RepID=A0A8X6X8B4_9ARAC|nr:hypothetical protein TNIN_136731 [Trichonephila inaurata madagascariensis]
MSQCVPKEILQIMKPVPKQLWSIQETLQTTLLGFKCKAQLQIDTDTKLANDLSASSGGLMLKASITNGIDFTHSRTQKSLLDMM